MKSINNARVSFDAAMNNPMDLVKIRFASLKLDGQPVEVVPYPRHYSLKIFNYAILYFEPDFDPSIKSKSHMIKIPFIEELLTSLEHCHLTDYTPQYRLCGKEGCGIFVQIGRRIRVPDIDVGGYNLREEVLRWIDFPVNNTMEKDHFLTTEKVRTSIDANSNSLDELL